MLALSGFTPLSNTVNFVPIRLDLQPRTGGGCGRCHQAPSDPHPVPQLFAPDAKPACSPLPTPSFPPFSCLLGFRAPLNQGVAGCCCCGDPQHRCMAAGGAAGWDLPGSPGAVSSRDLSAGRNQTSLFSPPGPPTLLRSDPAAGNTKFSLLPDPAIAQGSQKPMEQEGGAAGMGGVPPPLLPQLPDEVLSPP